MDKNNYTGFTLAEVLITLLIIGVVASLVIPAIINDTQKQEWVTGLQKSLAESNQAYRKWQLDIGVTDFAGNIPSTQDGFLNSFVQYFDVVKICYQNQRAGECFSQDVKYMNGFYASVPGDVDTHARAILKDGTMILIYGYSPSCTWTKNRTNGVADGCTEIFIDVNGFKEPNISGRDIFGLMFTRKNGVLPTGIMGSDSESHCGIGYSEACSAKIAKEGWKMNY